MKNFRLLLLGFLSLFLHGAVFASPSFAPTEFFPPYKSEHNGTAAFSVTDPNLWYNITTESYPEATLLSQGRNRGSAKGGVYLSPTGFTIGEPGDYYVSIDAVLQNPTEDTTVLIPVFLAIDDQFSQADPNLVGGIVTLPTAAINTLHGDGILRNIAPGTRLSLVATNAGYPDPVPVTVVSWSINIHKIN